MHCSTHGSVTSACVLQPGRSFYIWGGYANCAKLSTFLKKHDLYFSQAIIWDKQHPVLTRKGLHGRARVVSASRNDGFDGQRAWHRLRRLQTAIAWFRSTQKQNRLERPAVRLTSRFLRWATSPSPTALASRHGCTPEHLWTTRIDSEQHLAFASELAPGMELPIPVARRALGAYLCHRDGPVQRPSLFDGGSARPTLHRRWHRYAQLFYGWKLGAGHKFYGPNNVTDLWHVKKVPSQRSIHLTQKPTELAVLAMQYSSVKGENVLDLFGGSGSTLIGAEQCGRNAFLMELDRCTRM